MAATHPSPLEVVEQIYAAFADQDVDTVLAHCAPDVEVFQDPALPWGGSYVGADGVVDFALKLVGTIDSKVTVEGMFQAGEDVVQHGRTRGTVRANGADFDVAECHVWTVREGKAVAARFMIDSAAMLEALGR